MTTNYRANHAGLAAFARSAQMEAMSVQAAEVGRAYVEQLARAHSRTGEHAGSYEVRPEEVTTGRPAGKRRGAIIVNTADHGATVEFGNSTGRQGRHYFDEVVPIVEAMGG